MCWTRCSFSTLSKTPGRKSPGHGIVKSKREGQKARHWRGPLRMSGPFSRAPGWEWKNFQTGLETRPLFPPGALGDNPHRDSQRQGERQQTRKGCMGNWESHRHFLEVPERVGEQQYFPHVLDNGISWDVQGSSAKASQWESSVLAQARWLGFHRLSADLRWTEDSAGTRWENLHPRRHSWKDYNGGRMSSPRLCEHPRNEMQPHRGGLLRFNWENESDWAFLALTLLSFCHRLKWGMKGKLIYGKIKKLYILKPQICDLKCIMAT